MNESPNSKQDLNQEQVETISNPQVTLTSELASNKIYSSNTVPTLYGNLTPFKQSWQIQLRVIYALLIREIITRYGRKNLGFMWLFVEPLLITSLLALLWGIVKADTFSTINIVAFIITGYPLMMMWRNASNRAIGSIEANAALLYHRNVTPLDTILARIILELAGSSISQFLIMFAFIMLGIIDKPNNLFYMLQAWLLMAIFAIGLGLVITSISYHFEFIGKIWSTISFLMIPLSGAFFFLSSLPTTAQHFLSWFPMINGTEMFRAGYFGNQVITLESPWYLMATDICLLYLGLIFVRRIKFNHGK